MAYPSHRIFLLAENFATWVKFLVFSFFSFCCKTLPFALLHELMKCGTIGMRQPPLCPHWEPDWELFSYCGLENYEVDNSIVNTVSPLFQNLDRTC